MHPDGVTLLTVGYAGGNMGLNPEGKNNPSMQDRHNIGPLPCGLYTFNQVEDSPTLGPFAIPLIPDSNNQMYGRSHFYVHGDDIKHPGCGSKGCIVVPRFARGSMWYSNDHSIKVVA